MTAASPHDGGEPPNEQKAFARWVNKKSVFYSCKWDEFRYPGKEFT